MSTSKAKKDDAKKIVKIVFNVILWIFLIFSFIIMVFSFASISNDYGVPVLGKDVILTVASDSMKPTFNKGDLIVGTVLSDEEKAQLQVGDIITYFVDIDGDSIKELNTHRIVSIEGAVIKTKGDNQETNATVDKYDVYQKDIVCIWRENGTRIKGMGSFFSFLQSRIGFLCVIVIPLALFFIYEVIRFVLTVIKIKGTNRKSITAEDEEEIRRKAIEEYLRQKELEKASEQPTASTEPVADDKDIQE